MKTLTGYAKKYGYIVYPILFAIFPFLSFYGANAAEIRAGNFQISTFLLFNLIVGAIAWLIGLLITRKFARASIFAVVLLTIFFTFGRLHNQIQNLSIKTPIITVGPTKLLLGLSLILVIIVWFWLRRLSDKSVGKVNYTLTLVGIVMVASTLISVFSSSASTKTTQSDNTQTSTSEQKSAQNSPDIYYLLLDGYARADFLKNQFKSDNSGFIKDLSDRGFYVADKASSNYAHTHFSVPSTFNMKYLNYLSDELGENSVDRRPLKELLDQNKVVSTFKSLGYKYVNIGSQWDWTINSPQEDIEVEATINSESKILGIKLDEFALVYLQTTALKPWVASSFRSDFASKMLGAFERTKKVPTITDPTLTFTHVGSPHPPYVFDRNGIIPGEVDLDLDIHGFSNKVGFADQTVYINKLILELVDEILAKSDKPPIIIIASDHGPASDLKHSELANIDPNNFNKLGVRERLGILNAYYFPDKNYKNLYKNITPVNSFRLILNQYFNQKIELLPDRSYFSSNREKEYQFFDVTNIVGN